jgi:hypothetical protein
MIAEVFLQSFQLQAGHMDTLYEALAHAFPATQSRCSTCFPFPRWWPQHIGILSCVHKKLCTICNLGILCTYVVDSSYPTGQFYLKLSFSKHNTPFSERFRIAFYHSFEISGSYGDKDVEVCLLGCNARGILVSTCKPTQHHNPEYQHLHNTTVLHFTKSLGLWFAVKLFNNEGCITVTYHFHLQHNSEAAFFEE